MFFPYRLMHIFSEYMIELKIVYFDGVYSYFLLHSEILSYTDSHQ